VRAVHFRVNEELIARRERRGHFVGERIRDHASAWDAISSPQGTQGNTGEIRD
jgi:hypothetical protein